MTLKSKIRVISLLITKLTPSKEKLKPNKCQPKVEFQFIDLPKLTLITFKVKIVVRQNCSYRQLCQVSSISLQILTITQPKIMFYPTLKDPRKMIKSITMILAVKIAKLSKIRLRRQKQPLKRP